MLREPYKLIDQLPPDFDPNPKPSGGLLHFLRSLLHIVRALISGRWAA